jgi:CubicO group peptidase (beta-lactamase class C family)
MPIREEGDDAAPATAATCSKILSVIRFVLVAFLLSVAAAAQPVSTADVVTAVANDAISHHVPALSVAVVQGGKVSFAQGFGLAEIDNDVRATEQTVYRINSTTKAFTAAAILQLREAGKLHLTDRLSKYFPEYTRPDHDPTIDQLLHHSAGLADYHGALFAKNIRLDLVPKEWVDSINDDHLYLYRPGANWKYSNAGYDILGMIVSKTSGMTYDEYVKRHILDPAAMTATAPCNTPQVVKNRASSYAWKKDHFEHSISWGTYGEASGRLCSTVLDLARWLTALEDGRLLSRASLQSMRTPGELAPKLRFDYGLGTRLGHLGEQALIAYTGSGEEWTSAVVEQPDRKLTVIVLANADIEGWSAAHVATDVLKRLAGVALTIADAAVPRELASKLAGQWKFVEGGGGVEVTTAEGHLSVRPIGANIPPTQLLYLGGTRFVFGPNGPLPGTEFVFTTGDTTAVQSYANGIFMTLSIR